MRKLRYSSAAREDLESIATYISEQSGGRATGVKFTSELRSKCRDLAAITVIIGRPRTELRHDLRSFPYGSYVIFFRYLEDTFEIVNIIESHRDLGAIFEKD